jgi:hypothetical protein
MQLEASETPALDPKLMTIVDVEGLRFYLLWAAKRRLVNKVTLTR